MLRFVILAALCGWSLGFVAMPPMPDHRIVGGVPTTIAAHPHQVSLYGGVHHCGGSIISSSWVVTTVRCVYYTSRYTVGVGSADRYGGKKYSVKRIVKHPESNVYTMDYDIALLEINGPIQLNASVKPIRLATLELPTNSIANVTGWGALTAGGANSRLLLRISVSIIDRKVCDRPYSYYVTPRMICTKTAMDGKGPCDDDAGGALSSNGVLYGLVSWNSRCADAKYPTVYSNIASLRPWIRSVTGI